MQKQKDIASNNAKSQKDIETNSRLKTEEQNIDKIQSEFINNKIKLNEKKEKLKLEECRHQIDIHQEFLANKFYFKNLLTKSFMNIKND